HNTISFCQPTSRPELYTLSLHDALPILARLPPWRPSRCLAPAWRLARESPRAAPPNLSAVARSRYGAPPRCCGLCIQLASPRPPDRKSTRLNSSHLGISYAVFCLKKKKE